MRRLLFVLIGLVAILAGLLYIGDYGRERDSVDMREWSYWGYRHGPSGLSRPLFPVRVGGQLGFIDATGRVVIEPQFLRAYTFTEGLCVATTSSERSGYIDETGAWVIPPRFAMALPFRGGRAAVKGEDRGRFGYIDRTGTLVIPYRYYTASEFVDGVARVGHATLWGRLKGSFADVGMECWYEYIDLQGRRVAKPEMNNPRNDAEPRPLFPFGPPGKMGYKDANGLVVVEAIYARADPFEDGLGCVATEGGKNGYVDATGRMVWPPSQ
ncbi:MAG: WG repeat-containing protein [Phycisphaerales bacterium]